MDSFSVVFSPVQQNASNKGAPARVSLLRCACCILWIQYAIVNLSFPRITVDGKNSSRSIRTLTCVNSHVRLRHAGGRGHDWLGHFHSSRGDGMSDRKRRLALVAWAVAGALTIAGALLRRTPRDDATGRRHVLLPPRSVLALVGFPAWWTLSKSIFRPTLQGN